MPCCSSLRMFISADFSDGRRKVVLVATGAVLCPPASECAQTTAGARLQDRSLQTLFTWVSPLPGSTHWFAQLLRRRIVRCPPGATRLEHSRLQQRLRVRLLTAPPRSNLAAQMDRSCTGWRSRRTTISASHGGHSTLVPECASWQH